MIILTIATSIVITIQTYNQYKKVTVTAPVQIGEVIIKNVCGTGVDVIATKKVNALT